MPMILEVMVLLSRLVILFNIGLFSGSGVNAEQCQTRLPFQHN